MPNDSLDSETESLAGQRSVLASIRSCRLPGLPVLAVVLFRIVLIDELGENELLSRLGEVVAGELAG